jgi:hypothetical protein
LCISAYLKTFAQTERSFLWHSGVAQPGKKVVSKSVRMVATAKNPEVCKRALLEYDRHHSAF